MAIAPPSDDPAASQQQLESDFSADLDAEVAASMPKAVTLFLVLMMVALTIEWFYFPARSVPLAMCILSLVSICAGGVTAMHRFPQRAPHVTLVTVTLLAVVLATYLTAVANSLILCLIAMIGYLTGLVVLFPWGPRFQGAAAIGVGLIYVVALASSEDHALPVSYGIFALATHAFMTVLGAASLEAYRWTGFKQAARAQQSASEAARANQAKTDFLASVSHELRTPLNIIFGYTDLLIEDAFEREDDRNDALQRIRNQSGNLLDMIQAMLDINKLEAGGVTVTASEFRVGELMDRLQSNVPSSWRKEDVDLVWQTPGAEAVMSSDADKIQIVLRNLIHNALKYTDRGTVAVTAEATPGNCQVAFTVSDTGQGIPEDDLQRIFQMFQQSGTGPPRQGGVGLGLFLARQLTEALGGNIDAASTPGEGSRFKVELPLRAPEEFAVQLDPPTPRS